MFGEDGRKNEKENRIYRMARPLDVQRFDVVLLSPHSPRRNAYDLPRVRLSMVSDLLTFIQRFIVWIFCAHLPADVTRKIYSGRGFSRNDAGKLELLDQKEIGK